MSIDIIFVILHYNTIKETIECIESIKRNMSNVEFRILIIDNCSPNGTGEQLKEKYSKDPVVTVVSTDRNLGFARGNNAGIEYARNHYDFKYLCCLNNDTLLLDESFFETLENEYQKSGAAVIGPLIYKDGKGKDDSIQTFCGELFGTDVYEQQLAAFKKTLKHVKLYSVRERISRTGIYKMVRRMVRKIKGAERMKYFLLPHEDVVLAGACLIFTPSFFTKLKGFNPKTFLFREEELLYLDVKSSGLNTMYCPGITIYHKRHVSIKASFGEDVKRHEFVFKNHIASTEILIDELKRRGRRAE